MTGPASASDGGAQHTAAAPGVLPHGMYSALSSVAPVGLDPATWRGPAWREAAAAACGSNAATHCSFLRAGGVAGVATIGAIHRTARQAIQRVALQAKTGLSQPLDSFDLLHGWRQAGQRVELHLFGRAGDGFRRQPRAPDQALRAA